MLYRTDDRLLPSSQHMLVMDLCSQPYRPLQPLRFTLNLNTKVILQISQTWWECCYCRVAILQLPQERGFRDRHAYPRFSSRHCNLCSCYCRRCLCHMHVVRAESSTKSGLHHDDSIKRPCHHYDDSAKRNDEARFPRECRHGSRWSTWILAAAASSNFCCCQG